MQPSLNDSYLRVKRAKEHIRSLTRLRKKLTIDPNAITVEPPPPPQGVWDHDGRLVVTPSVDNIAAAFGHLFQTPKFTVPDPPPLNPKWAIYMGEAIYNLRAALDYLVYSLAYLDSGSEQKGTQFPIVDSPEDFQRLLNSRKTPLSGVSNVHVAALEGLQPYPGRDGLDSLWLAQLRDFSNPDKHRRLTILKPRTGTVTSWSVGAPSKPVQVQFGAAYQVTLGDANNSPVIPTLDSLLAHVSETLDQFLPDFERQ